MRVLRLNRYSPPAPTLSRVRYRLTLILCTLVVLSTIGTWWVERQLSGPIVEWARVRATNMASTAINGAIRDVLSGRLGELETFQYSYPPGGDQPILRYNMGPLNQVMSDAVQSILDTFRAHAPEEFRIPFGEVTGMRIFAGWGPSVPARIVTTGSVVAEPKVDFQSAGINQVLHRLYVDVTVRMIVVAPFLRDDIVVNQSVIVAEELIPGRVPDTYVNLVGYSGGLESWMALMAGRGTSAVPNAGQSNSFP